MMRNNTPSTVKLRARRSILSCGKLVYKPWYMIGQLLEDMPFSFNGKLHVFSDPLI